MIYPEANVISERRYGNSRFDFYVENGNEKLFIEVKGVTLFRDGRALFPDAPTERGIKHLSELAKCIEEGYIPKVFFVIASDFDGNIVFSPNRAIENEFANALKTLTSKLAFIMLTSKWMTWLQRTPMLLKIP